MKDVFCHEKEVHRDVEEDKDNEAYAQVATGLRVGHEITEAHEVVHEEDASTLIENLHSVGELRLHGPEVGQVDDHEDGEDVLDGQLHPEELGDDDNCEAKASPSHHEDAGVDDGQPLAGVLFGVLGAFKR